MLQFDKRQIKILAVMGAIIIGLISFIIFKDNFPCANKSENIEKIPEDTPDASVDHEDSTNAQQAHQQDRREPETVKIYIAGQVQNPGVIEVPSDCRLNEAVEMAGGFLADADLLRINLAIRVQDEGMYLIPKIGEEYPKVDSPVMGDQGNSSKVNINTADQSQLETLPRIGPVIARSIIEYREENGSFKNEKDIMNVPRIGEKTFQELKDLITVR